MATQKKPLAQIEELAYLKVVDNTKIGAFLDWGLEKDLFLPFSEQRYQVKVGKSYLVAIYEDNRGRLCATTAIYDYLKSNSPYKKNDWVTGTVYLVKKEIGVLVAVDNQYLGLIPANEYFRAIKPGDIVETRVIRVRDDGKLDLSPRKLAYQQIDRDAEVILKKAKAGNGFLPLNDNSDPSDIKKQLNMSKKSFKRAVGRLLKERKIELIKKGLKLKIEVVSEN